MTIDPILAQGFTVAMEGAYALKHSVQNSCLVDDPDSKLAFDPYRKYPTECMTFIPVMFDFLLLTHECS